MLNKSVLSLSVSNMHRSFAAVLLFTTMCGNFACSHREQLRKRHLLKNLSSCSAAKLSSLRSTINDRPSLCPNWYPAGTSSGFPQTLSRVGTILGERRNHGHASISRFVAVQTPSAVTARNTVHGRGWLLIASIALFAASLLSLAFLPAYAVRNVSLRGNLWALHFHPNRVMFIVLLLTAVATFLFARFNFVVRVR
jgi:hypothetical protein